MFGAVCVASPLAFHLRLRDGGLVAAAPPCSLFVPACASVHKRSIARPRGDQRNFKVRLAGRIWTNFVAKLTITSNCVEFIYSFLMFFKEAVYKMTMNT